jgi:parallel beta-helix repeat protein
LLIEGDRREAVLRLDEAIGRASEGAEIRLAPGEHRLAKPLEINKSLTLVGPGPDQCRVTCAGEGFVIGYSGNGTFAARGIRFEHVGSEFAHVLVIASGQIDLENCVCRGAVRDDGRNIGGDGLCATGSAEGTVRNCRFEHNGLHGVELTFHAALTLEGNTCQQNDRCGIAFFGNSTGQVYNNVCRENGLVGIGVFGESWPTLEANRCEGNKKYGILFAENATGIARKNICTGDLLAGGIFVSSTAAPVLHENVGEVLHEPDEELQATNPSADEGAGRAQVSGAGASSEEQPEPSRNNHDEAAVDAGVAGAVLGCILGIILAAITVGEAGAAIVFGLFGAGAGAIIGAAIASEAAKKKRN